MLAEKLRFTFSKMILFNGALSFNPNTLNNTYMSYALAKRWEEDDTPYESWIQLISKVKEINDDVQNFARNSGKSEQEIHHKYNVKLFSDWSVDGDAAVYSSFTAKAVFDPSDPQPLKELQKDERFPVSSPIGSHKAVIADMDTDSQSKSKIFGFQLIIGNEGEDKLSLALQPSEFRNITKKYSRDIFNDVPTSYSDGHMPAIFGVDWFMIGSMKLLSHKDTPNIKHQILKDFAQEISKTSPESMQQVKNRFILKMNQFNYNYQNKLSFISGYIEPTSNKQPLPTVNWRTITLPIGEKSTIQPYENRNLTSDPLPLIPKTLYMREVKNGDKSIGILLDLNNLVQVVTFKGQFAYKDYLTIIIQNTKDLQKIYRIKVSKEEMESKCGMYFIKGGSLDNSPYRAAVSFQMEKSQRQQSLDFDPFQTGKSGQETPKLRYFVGVQKEYSFQILERFKKTKHLGDGDNALNVEAFSPYIEYQFRCMRLGQPIPQDIYKDLKVTLKISQGYGLGDTPMDVRGIFQYADNQSDKILEQVLNSSTIFKAKYQNIANIKKVVYQSKYDDIQEIANTLKQQIQKVDSAQNKTYFWKNSKGEHFATQFNNPSFSDKSQTQTVVKVDENGRGKFKVYLNENLTRHNNPRTLLRSRSDKDCQNPILSSIAVECNIISRIQVSDRCIEARDSISGTYFESNPDKGQQSPDWKNYVGPRLRLMGLLYPAMQRVVNLYSFNGVDLDAMKRAFDIQDERHSRYMPATREISPFEHRMIRRWLYEPFFDHKQHTNIDFTKCHPKPDTLDARQSFAEKKNLLRQKLKDAFSFQLFTIPLYLTAMYTTDSPQYQQTFRQVIHDEMKHLFIASNLINAIREPNCSNKCDGPPYLDPNYVPQFDPNKPTVPRYVYDTTNSAQSIKDLYTFGIAPLNDEVLLKMIAAEFPSQTKNLILSTKGIQDEDKIKRIEDIQKKVINPVNLELQMNKDFHTIGQLYAEIVDLLWDLHDKEQLQDAKGQPRKNVLFSGEAANQFTYSQLTNMQEIYSLRTALNQIRLIIDEGEGSRIFDVRNKLKKLCHFLKFIEVYTGCKVDQDKTDELNNIDAKSNNSQEPEFIIYFKDMTVTRGEKKNNWTAKGQNEQLRQFVYEERDGRRAYGYSNYTNIAAIDAFPNVYKKILTELHYVFNSSFDNFKEYIIKKKNMKSNNLPELESEFKSFKFRRMENAIAKMRQMSLHARDNIRAEPYPNYEVKAPIDSIESKGNQGHSVRPDYNITVEFPEDDN